MDDPIKGVSGLPKSAREVPPRVKRVPPCDTIFPFLYKALFPGPSSNQSKWRFDTAILDSLVHIDRPIHILDLGCGEGLILEKIQQSHPVGNDGHLPGTCHYLGIDLLAESPKWQRLKTYCAKCFPTPHYSRIDLNDEAILGKVLEDMKFDFIFLANVFHELPPRGWPTLLGLLFDHLKPRGHLVIVDPDVDWCFQRAAWSPDSAGAEPHLENIPVEWEVDAVWLSRAAISSALESAGFKVNVKPFERSRMSLWEATGSIEEESIRPVPAQVVESFRQYLKTKIADEQARIPNLRHELREEFQKHHPHKLSGELLVRIFEYFAVCASQCRRLEALEELR